MAKKKKASLDPMELQYIGQREAVLDSILGTIQEVTKFKTGDFLIAFHPQTQYSARQQITNSYGAPKKFTVIHTDKYGIPYMKELNKNGTPVGRLISAVRFDDANRARVNTNIERVNTNIEFEVDPDYADAIIMADEENYDAANIHKIKSETFKEITKYNKSIKVKFKTNVDLLQFLKTLKVGDVFWKSIKTSFTILTLDPIPTTHGGKRLVEYKVFGTAQDSKGKVFNLDHTKFHWHAIYTAQPRSYNELKDPK